jgi:hypothetical protein
MSGIFRHVGLGVGCATVLVSSVSQASTLRAMSTEELVRDSSAIAVGRVISTQAIRRGGRITTLATFEVRSPVKGLDKGQRIFIRVPGGATDEWAQRVEGAPVMRDGDDCVVFLESGGPSTYQVVGLEQGKLDIVPDPLNPDQWVVRRSFTAPRVAPGPDGISQPAELLPETEPLDAYLDRVRSLAREHP